MNKTDYFPVILMEENRDVDLLNILLYSSSEE